MRRKERKREPGSGISAVFTRAMGSPNIAAGYRLAGRGWRGPAPGRAPCSPKFVGPEVSGKGSIFLCVRHVRLQGAVWLYRGSVEAVG